MDELRLYDYAPSANCYKVRLLLAQLGRTYQRVPVDIFAGETLGEEFAAKNAARTTPVLEYSPGRYLPESNAILLYLADGTELLPAGREQRAHVHRWLFYEQAEVVPAIGGLRFRLLTGRLASRSADAERRRRAAGEVLAVLEGHLAQRQFLVDEGYSVTDIGVYGYVHVAADAGLDLEPYASVRRWLARVRRRPRFVDDLAPYPPNALAGAGSSIYD